MKKLVLSLCVLSLVVFGLSACSDASADSTPAADNTELTARVAALEATVAALQNSSGIRVFNLLNRTVIGYALNVRLRDITLLTPNGYIIYSISWTGDTEQPIFYFGRPYCEGNIVAVANDDYGSMSFYSNHQRILIFNNEYYRVDGAYGDYSSPINYVSHCIGNKEYELVNESGSLNAWIDVSPISEEEVGIPVSAFSNSSTYLILLAPNQPLPPY
jgi:hypothetical protein